MDRRQERELAVWKKWFFTVHSPPASTGICSDQDTAEINKATGKDTFCMRVVISASFGQTSSASAHTQYKDIRRDDKQNRKANLIREENNLNVALVCPF